MGRLLQVAQGGGAHALATRTLCWSDDVSSGQHHPSPITHRVQALPSQNLILFEPKTRNISCILSPTDASVSKIQNRSDESTNFLSTPSIESNTRPVKRKTEKG